MEFVIIEFVKPPLECTLLGFITVEVYAVIFSLFQLILLETATTDEFNEVIHH